MNMNLPCANTGEEYIKNRKRQRRNERITALLSFLCVSIGVGALALSSAKQMSEFLDKGGLGAYISSRVFGDGQSGEKSFANLMISDTFGAPPKIPDALPIDEKINEDEIAEDDTPTKTDFAALENKAAALTEKELYAFDYSAVPDGQNPIVPCNLSDEYDMNLKYNNETSFDIDFERLEAIADDFAGAHISAEPLVLIVHTHGTESFSQSGSISYSETYNIPRSEDTAENVVAVGDALTKTLVANGIGTIHCETMHDRESYIEAYTKSAATVKRLLEKYPTIEYVFDIHRDSVIDTKKNKMRPVTIIDGKVCAQIMSIVGTNEKGANHSEWEKNLVFGIALQKKLNKECVGLARSILIRGAAYNQQYRESSLLIEIGSCGNTLEEAKNSAVLLGKQLAAMIKGES